MAVATSNDCWRHWPTRSTPRAFPPRKCLAKCLSTTLEALDVFYPFPSGSHLCLYSCRRSRFPSCFSFSISRETPSTPFCQCPRHGSAFPEKLVDVVRDRVEFNRDWPDEPSRVEQTDVELCAHFLKSRLILFTFRPIFFVWLIVSNLVLVFDVAIVHVSPITGAAAYPDPLFSRAHGS